MFRYSEKYFGFFRTAMGERSPLAKKPVVSSEDRPG
jgi:hypothetical protein